MPGPAAGTVNTVETRRSLSCPGTYLTSMTEAPNGSSCGALYTAHVIQTFKKFVANM